jgi:hypothetical protein
MPIRPETEPGAVVVDFPWADAAAAVAALDAAANELTAQIETRGTMRQSITDWDGPYRDEHDDEHFRLVQTLWGLAGTLSFRAAAVVSGAEDAAEQQLLNNAAAIRENEQRARLRAQRDGAPVGGS